MPSLKPTEKSLKSTPTREIFEYIDPSKKVKVISKEVYKNKDIVIHYPFRKDNGEPKYETIRKIVYQGFTQVLPRGILKSANTGYGFTKVLAPLIYFLQDKFKIETIYIVNHGTNELNINKKSIVFSAFILNKYYPVFDNLLDSQRKQIKSKVKDVLHKIFPSDIESSVKEYTSNTVYSFLLDILEFTDEFSKNDINAIFDAFKIISKHHELIDPQIILKTRQQIEEIFIEDVIKNYAELLEQKTETEQLEEKWQNFFKTNIWIFSQLLSFPVILYEDKAYVGGKDISNAGGKVADFLIKNKLTNNAAFIEIKTHQSRILKSAKAYRGKDVFPISDDLTGAINQVLDQRDNFQKEYYVLQGRSKNPIQTYNSKCIVVIGMLSKLNEEAQKSFELFRSNSKDVDIITYDELFDRLKTLQKLMVQN